MGIKLQYKHQEKTYERMKEKLEETGKAAYVYPTGCGKSFPALKYIEDNQNENETSLVVVPSMFLKKQYERYIKKYMDNGEQLLSEKKIVVITYKSLHLMMDVLKNYNFGIAIFDEAHRIGAKTYEEAVDRFMKSFPDAKKIAFSATPERMDGRNMLYEKFGDSIVYEMSLTEALDGSKENEVVLNSPKYVRMISALKPVLDAYENILDSITDDNKRKRLKEKLNKLNSYVSVAPEISKLMEQAMQKKNGKYLVFCTDREEMYEKMQKAYEIFGKVNSNIKIDYVISKDVETSDGKSSRENRETLEEFESRPLTSELQLLFSVDMLIEGNHIEGIDGEIMFRETESQIVYKQTCGRVMSSDKESRETIIIDAVNNWIRQIDTFKEFYNAIGTGNGLRNKNELNPFELSIEELEFLDVLKEIGEATKYNYFDVYEETINWLDNHNGKLPRRNIYKGGREILQDKKSEEEKCTEPKKLDSIN